MTEEELVKKGKEHAAALSEILRNLSDKQVWELMDNGTISELLNSILNPADRTNYRTIGDFLLANKHRATLLSAIRAAITKYYSFKGTVDGKEGYASPAPFQWFEDAVMVLESDKPFEGSIGRYGKDGSLSYAIADRDIKGGEEVKPEHFKFIDIAEMRRRLKALPAPSTEQLEEPIARLRKLLDEKSNDEKNYQELLQDYPWILGLEYQKIQRHEHFDDENIPDFTGVKVSNQTRDIFEVKPPFMQMFRKNGTFRSEFLQAWDQAERYLNFAREYQWYLQKEKGLLFDNPKCYLIVGFNLPSDKIPKIRSKEKMNAAIRLLTYNDLLAFMEHTVKFIRDKRTESGLTKP
jgi:hypothetical protein